MVEQQTQTIVAQLPQSTGARWGALIAGLVLTTAVGWFLMILGSALGMSVADASDMEALGEGFGIAASLWLMVSWLVAYFVGALLTARLIGSDDTAFCVLHGVALWGLALVLTVVLASMGVRGVLNTGKEIAVGGAQALATGAGVSAETVMGSGLGTEDVPNVPNRVQAELKREAARMLTAADQPGGADVSPEEVRAALDQLDGETLQRAAIALLREDPEGAKDVLSAETRLSEDQIEALVSGASARVESTVAQLREKLSEAAETASDP